MKYKVRFETRNTEREARMLCAMYDKDNAAQNKTGCPRSHYTTWLHADGITPVYVIWHRV